ncbi:MAG: carboxypeptidase regulatory-like domain-containing protein [Bryobacterales bacterium]|nr:carboxypeptidase regulatory-like domain-containing protein [Bryobacterales bacterium]
MRWLYLLGMSGLMWGQAGLRGVVSDEGGAPLGGALVTATREFVQADEVAPGRYSAITKSDGTFEILGMAAGTYAVCGAKQPHEGYVDFCAWTLQPPRVVLVSGSVRSGYGIRLEKGVRVEAAFYDPDGVLHGKEEGKKREQLRAGVAGPGLPPNGMYFSQSDGGKAEYFLYVPKRMGVKVVASAGDGDLGKRADAPGLARKDVGEDVGYVEGRGVQRVEFRYFKRKE